jgi:hypothetical protein
MAQTELERRRHPRIPCALPVRLCCGDKWTDATARNLSLEGMLLSLVDPASSEDEISVSWVIPETSTRLRVVGRVVRRNAERGELGLQFSALAPQVVEGIQGEVERMARSPQSGVH